jgi:hypothetical protein
MASILGAFLSGVLFAVRLASAETATDAATVLQLRYVTVVVKSYDDALSWYTNVLGLRKIEDRGVHFLKPPADRPWGTTQAVFEDLYGNVFVAESEVPHSAASNSSSRP